MDQNAVKRPQVIYVIGRGNNPAAEAPAIEDNLRFLSGRDGVDFDLHVVGRIDQLFDNLFLRLKVNELTSQDPHSQEPITIIMDGHGRDTATEVRGKFQNDAFFDKTPLSTIFQELAEIGNGRPLHILVLSCDGEKSLHHGKRFLPRGSIVYGEETFCPRHISICRDAEAQAYGRFFGDDSPPSLFTEFLVARLMRGKTTDATSDGFLSLEGGVTSLFAAAKRIALRDPEGLKQRVKDLGEESRVTAKILNGVIYFIGAVKGGRHNQEIRKTLERYGQLAPLLAITALYMLTEPREKWGHTSKPQADSAPS